MESFSTRGLSAPSKVAYWNALSSETFAAMEITPHDAAAFDGELRRESIGNLTLMDVRSDAVRIRHTHSHVARVPTPSYLLLTPLRGDFQMRLDRQTPRCVATGEYCLLDHAQPYELQHGDAVRVLCLDIPRTALGALLPRPEAAVGRIMRTDTSVSRLLAVLLREIGGAIEPLSPARFAQALAQGLLGFIAAAYADEPDAMPCGAMTRRQALLIRIEARLQDPELAPPLSHAKSGFRHAGCARSSPRAVNRSRPMCCGGAWSAAPACCATPAGAAVRSPISRSGPASTMRRTSAMRSSSDSAAPRVTIVRGFEVRPQIPAANLPRRVQPRRPSRR